MLVSPWGLTTVNANLRSFVWPAATAGVVNVISTSVVDDNVTVSTDICCQLYEIFWLCGSDDCSPDSVTVVCSSTVASLDLVVTGPVAPYAETDDKASANIVTDNIAKIAFEFNLCVLIFRILKTFLLNDLLARIAKKVGK